MAGKLTPKQQAFVDAYLLSLNASEAVRQAGYKVKRADQQGYELLSKPEIAAAIAQAQQERAKRTQIDADWLLKRLAARADADIADLYNDDGSLKNISEWPEVWRKGLVAGIEVVEEWGQRADGEPGKEQVGWVKKVKIADRTKELELIGRHVNVGAFREKVEHTGPNGGPIQTEQAVHIYLPDNGR